MIRLFNNENNNSIQPENDSTLTPPSQTDITNPSDYSSIPSSSNLQFPELTDVVPSVRTVQVLKRLAYSLHSELTALSTYLYQDWLLNQKCPDFASELEKIAIVEMEHLDQLSNAIVAFGGRADMSVNGAYWSARAVNQTSTLPLLLQQNIVGEKNAIADYKLAITQVENESLKTLFEKIISDEEQHIIIFNNMIEYYKSNNKC